MTNADSPVDINHLNQYTGGNADLNREILQLFESQCLEMITKLETVAGEDGPGSKNWREITHTLKGAARGIGAFALANVAAEAEKITTDKVAAREVLHRLKSKACAVQLFIDSFLKRDF